MQTVELSTQLFSQAATLMAVGMVFVFGFLGIMIIVVKFLIAPLAKKFPDSEPQSKKATPINSTKDSTVVAAITIAVHKYRQKYR